MRKRVAFVWENFGPPHTDRCEAVAAHMADWDVLGVELWSRSAVYDWDSPASRGFEKVTLFEEPVNGQFRLFWRITRLLLKKRVQAVFFCHYEKPAIFAAATVLRLLGSGVFSTNDSKFDDYPRHLWREVLKTIFLTPYRGALAASPRCRDYLRFLGLRHDRVLLGAYCISADRVRLQVRSSADATPYGFRHFAIIARLVPKKNISTALQAFALLPELVQRRRLLICGSGPLEAQLRDEADKLGIGAFVDFKGFVQTEGVSTVLSGSLALLLPSVEEQFGQVVEEAQALGIPVILSPQCGAVDELVRNGVNGFVCEYDNPQGFAFYMQLLANDASLWDRLSKAALSNEPLFALPRFAEGVRKLVDSAG